ncbi:hypothetical protein B0T25DRAFT_533363 [Lasiosphaeria hispida]|uniref:Uncharacterized protein n=1 Tax=Lasiosphaeria hispida TaxID=260671 RepID=A0AAJ0MHT9_9PEZI|nr:hypothetical protein B0T25DRAFT_533363 [Lasiosphaeria hispida]
MVGGELKLEHTIDRDTADATGVRGSIDLRGRNWGAKNSVSWTLWENKSAKTGVLSSMPAAILLKRRDMCQFKATITIKIAADSKTTLGAAFKTNPKDDDIWYDPERGPQVQISDRPQSYVFDADNLGQFELQSVAAGVPFHPTLKGTETLQGVGGEGGMTQVGSSQHLPTLALFGEK